MYHRGDNHTETHHPAPIAGCEADDLRSPLDAVFEVLLDGERLVVTGIVLSEKSWDCESACTVRILLPVTSTATTALHDDHPEARRSHPPRSDDVIDQRNCSAVDSACESDMGQWQ